MGEDPFTFLPLTFHIEHGVKDPEFDKFRQYYNILEEEKKTKSAELNKKKKEFIKNKRKLEGYGSEDSDGNGSICEEDEDYYFADIVEDLETYFDVIVPKNIWILKPGENSNRGHGITVCSNMREVIAEINSPEKRDHTHIV